MLKKTIIVLGLSAISIAGMQTGANAGGKGYSGYDGLWWNGPDGTDHNVLFKKSTNYKTYSYKGCKFYKRKYIQSGKKSWLRKYEICKTDED